jgi:hypothetical protein
LRTAWIISLSMSAVSVSSCSVVWCGDMA